jgi:hypothetical protein
VTIGGIEQRQIRHEIIYQRRRLHQPGVQTVSQLRAVCTDFAGNAGNRDL